MINPILLSMWQKVRKKSAAALPIAATPKTIVLSIVAKARRKSKNLFNGYWESGFINTSNGADKGDSACIRTGYIEITPKKSYYFYVKNGTNVYSFLYDENKNFTRALGLSAGKFRFATMENEHYIRVSQYKDTVPDPYAQLEEGSEPTEFEPYQV